VSVPKKNGPFVAILLFVLIAAPVTAQTGSFQLTLEASSGASAGGTMTSGRPLLPRLSVGWDLGLALETKTWIPLLISIGGFSILPSFPDSTYFLYRGIEGTYLKAETGPRFDLPRATLGGLAKQGIELDVLGGAAFAAVQDTGTTLVSADLLFLLDPRLRLEIGRGIDLTLALPLEFHPNGGARTLLAGARLGFSWTAPSEAAR